ncbi:MAG: glycosyltransferase family 2 protein [Bacteroidota bacterium]
MPINGMGLRSEESSATLRSTPKREDQETRNEEPSIALVTVLFNGKENLTDFFESVARQTVPKLHLYLIDNSPTPDVLEQALIFSEQLSFPVTSHRNEENLGAAAGNNQGIQRAIQDGHDYILLLNNDLYFPEETFQRLLNHAKQRGESILSPKIYNATTGQIWFAGGRMLHQRGINSHRGATHEDRGQFDRVEYVEYAPTTFMLLKADVFRGVGLLDEAYFAYFEDTDFVMRANRMGYRICYCPDATVYHKVSSTTGGKQSNFSLYYLNRNRVYFIRKQYQGLKKARAFLGAAREKWRWYRTADTGQRKIFREAVRDGWRMPVSGT